MNIIINGEKRSVSPKSTIANILHGYDVPGAFVIEVNGEIIDRDGFESHVLNENDTIEIIRFVGGG